MKKDVANFYVNLIFVFTFAVKNLEHDRVH